MKIAPAGLLLLVTPLLACGSDGNPNNRPYAGMHGGVIAVQTATPDETFQPAPAAAMYDPNGPRASTAILGLSGDRGHSAGRPEPAPQPDTHALRPAE